MADKQCHDTVCFVFGGLSGRSPLVPASTAAFWKTPNSWVPERSNLTTSHLRQCNTSENTGHDLNLKNSISLPQSSKYFSLCIVSTLSPCSSECFLSWHHFLFSFSQTDLTGGGADGHGSNHGLPADVTGAAGTGAGGRTGGCQKGPKVSRPLAWARISDALMVCYNKIPPNLLAVETN